MKTFRMIGMALFAVLMCVNLASCSSSDDDPTEEPEEGGVVVSGKRLAKITGKSADGSYSETYTFSYDNKGRLIEATETAVEGKYTDTETYKFIWGDDLIKVNQSKSSYTLTLKNGFVQYEDYGDNEIGTYTYTYNSSNRLIKFSDGESWTETAIWDGDKLVSTSDDDDEGTLTYGTTCQKGYFPFIATIIEAGLVQILYMAHPEIAGMRTTQLPTSITWTHTDDYSGKTNSETTTFAYEFDKEGYISIIKCEEESSFTYTLTWQ